MDKPTAESLLRALHAGTDLVRAARAHHLSLGDLARWSASGPGAEAIAALRVLAQARSALAVSRARADAARALARLARSADANETARKACVDILRLPEPDPGARADDADGDGDYNTLSPDEARAWLDALETLGAPRERAPDPDNAEDAGA